MRIGRVKGVQILLNNYFLLLMGLFALVGLAGKALLVFAVILLHELAHVASAVGCGLKVREIELLPFGGVARIEGLSETSAATEIKVAAAGPASNFVMAAIAAALGDSSNLSNDNMELFLRTNILLGVFNLLPALPLDGGRIFRALLSGRVGYKRGSEITAAVGRYIAIGSFVASTIMAYYGQLNLSLIVVSVFLYASSRREKALAAYAVLRQLTKKKEELSRLGVMPSVHFTARDDTAVADIIRRFEPQKYHWVFVVDKGYIHQGAVSESDILEGVLVHGLFVPCGQLLQDKN